MSGADVQLDVIEPRRRRRWWLWALLLILGAPLLLCIGGCGLWWYKDHQLRERIAAIRERGEPVTAEDLDAFYVAPPLEQDATELWTRAGVLLEAACQTDLAKRLPYVSGDDEIPDAPPPGTPWNDLPLAEQFLRENALAMQLLHDAAKKGGGARFPYDFSQGYDMLLPEVQRSRTCARCLALQSRVLAHCDDVSGAAASIRVGLSLAVSNQSEPIIISQLLRIATQEIVDNELKQLLPAVDFVDDDLAEFQASLLSTDYQPGLRAALLGERVFGLIEFEKAIDPTMLGPPATSIADAMHHGDTDAYLTLLEGHIAAVSRPCIDSPRIEAEFKQRVRKYHIRTQLFGPALGAMSTAAARGTADARITGLAIALERYRRAHGRPPARLADLSPEFVKTVPTDPHTGEPFHYETTADGYLLYSLESDSAKREYNTDPETGALESLVFRYPPKPWKPPEAREASEDMPAIGPEAVDGPRPAESPP